MGDLKLKCAGCGTEFVWTRKEQKEFEENSPGALFELYCKSCRPKQDGQRS